MREKKGILIVVSGFSGAGKGTLMKKLMQDYDNYALSISATTRQPRVGEEDGREYFFRTKEEFEKMIARDELIEYARYVENYYGTPKQYVMEQLEAGKDVILEIEIQGALKVKEKYPGYPAAVRDSAECAGTERQTGRTGNRDRRSDRFENEAGSRRITGRREVRLSCDQ